MTSKITGFQNHPVQVGTESSVSRARGEAASAAKPSGSSSSAGSRVHITDRARTLAALEQAVNSAPVVNEGRVAALRSAIQEGRYEVVAERVADRLLRMDRDLRAAEK